MNVLKGLVPNRYAAGIYLMFIVPAIIYFWQPISPLLSRTVSAYPERELVSIEPRNGYTYGDIARIDGLDGQMAKAVYRGRGYKVYVVYAVSHRSAPHSRAITQVTSSGGGYRSSGTGSVTRVITVPGRITDGPAIICTGHNRYAFIAAPVVERSGFLGIGRKKTNSIRKLMDTGADLDTSLYSTDCAPPSEAVLDAARTQFQVYLPPA